MTVLNKNYEFQRVYRRGKSYLGPLAVTYAFKKRTGGLRLGITAAKKVGCAVQRNRAKRVVRAALSQLPVRGDYDIVIVCRTAAAHCKMQDMLEELKRELSAAGALGR